ncbi:MAG: hypothetical protein G01um101413_810 [Parcubacteria group bacterium Gr01-1014_13]|nr:MAG: hypothetical protein G01um101413_810 [Parcubacteria group bacterium Gr01-1014_13]
MSESKSENDDEDPGIKNWFALIHEEWLVLGKSLANFLSRDTTSIPAELDATDGIEPFRHEIRHAPSLARATPREIRCTAMIAEFSSNLEGLVFQEEEGPPLQLTLSNYDEVLVENHQSLPKDYFVERTSGVISCKKETAEKLFDTLMMLLYQEIISLPMFTSTVRGRFVHLIHNGK